MTTVAALFTVLIGTLCVWALRPVHPRDLFAVGVNIAAGIAFGIGLTGVVFSVLAFAGLNRAPIVFAADIVILGAVGAFTWRGRMRSVSAPQDRPRAGWLGGTLAGAAGVAILLFAISFADTSAAYPHGGWDAWAIWNLRAKYLTTPETAPYATSPLLGATHPDYPLLTSSAIARMWLYGAENAPAAIAFLSAMAVLLFLFFRLAELRSLPAGGIAVVLALCWLPFADHAPMQYADVPLAAFLVCATGFAVGSTRGEFLAAGAMAGFAAFTKNEGLVFAILFLIAFAMARRTPRATGAVLLGASPGLLLALIFKFAIAPAVDPLVQQGMGTALSRLTEGGRWTAVARGFITEIGQASDWYTHPLLLLALVTIGLGVDRLRVRQTLVVACAAAALLAADFAVYLVTPSDVRWQMGTSFGRLLVQLWPAALLSVLLMLRDVPVPAVPAAPAVAPPVERKPRKRR